MGKLIVVEGIDCSGKTSVCKRIAGDDWVYVKTPPKKNKALDEENELSNYLKGLLSNGALIREKIEEKNIICDRYLATFIVDSEQVGKKVDFGLLKKLPKPDIIIHLVSSYENVVARLESQESLSDWERRLLGDKKLYESVKERFRDLCDIEIENNYDLDATVEEVISHIN